MASFYEDFKKKKEQNSSKSAKASDVVKVTPTRAVNKTLPKATKVTTSKQTAQKKAQQQRERAAALGLDSSDLLPLPLLKRDAVTGTTTKDKITYAKTSGLAGKRSAAEIANWKKDGKQAARQKRSAAQTLSKSDKKLSKRDRNLIRDAKTSYDEAKEKGDTAGMKLAHKRAETIRKGHGYSGGATGEEYNSPELSKEERVLLNQDGQERLKMARMNLEAAQAAGNENGIAAAERAVKRILETDAFRNEGTKKLSGFVTGHGQTVDRKSMTLEEFKDAEKKFNEGLYSAMAAVPGSILSLVETSNKAIENSIREKNRDYIDRKANELDSLRARLALAKRGEGNPAWGTVEQLEQRIKIAENAEKMRSSGTTVDPNLPGQTLMRKSAESRQKFMEGRTGVDRLLASAGLSMAQMVPALAASAIPGVGPAVGAGIMGAQAAGSKAYELNERGVSPAESQMRGVVSGGIEALTEKIPISSLLKVVKAGGGASLIKTMAKQAGIEATEESVSYALNYAADVAAKDPEAKFSMNDLLESAAVGAISGGTLGGVGSVVGSKLSYGQAQDTAQPSRLERIGQQALMKASGLKDRLSPPAETTQTTPEQVPTQAVEEHSAQEERTEQAAETPRERFNRRYQDVMARIQAAVDDPAQQTADGYAALSSELQTIMEEGNRLTQQERQEAGQVSRNFGEAESHIDNRTPEEMGSRSVKAFQFDHPQLHQYFVQAAEALKRDAAYSFETQRSERGNGTVVRRSEQLERAEGMGLTRNEIIRVCDDIIADNGQENYAAAKRVELILDDMLSRGYIPNEGTTEADTKIPANEAYIQAKNQIPGAVTGFDRYKRDNSLSLELGEVTEEELKAEYDSKHETDQDSLTAILRANLPALSDMVEVATVTGDEIPSFGKATDRIMSFVKSLGGKVSRDGFGDVLFSRSKIKNSFLGHGVGEGKIRLFAAVPAVIRNGEQIGYSSNWKGRGYDTYTFAAPVDYFGDTVYVAAIVAKDNLSNRYYLHEAVDQNGELLYGNEKNQMQPSDRLTGDPQGTVATPGYTNRIAQNTPDVNGDTLPEGMGAASSGFDPYSKSLNEHGAINPGEIPSRMVDVPKSTNGRDRVRKFARTYAESPGMTEELMQEFERGVVSGLYSYAPKKQKDSLSRAIKNVETYGFDGAMEQWREVVDGRRACTDEDIIQAQVLLSSAQAAGDVETASSLSAQIAAEGTAAGRTVNAFRLLKRTTPDGRLYYLRRCIDKINQEIYDNGKDYTVNLNGELAQALLGAETEEEIDAALGPIYDDIASQIPPTIADRINAWRYLAMLGNPRTHLRNIIGNVVFGQAVKARDSVSSILQGAILRGDKADLRTRTFRTDKAAKEFAKADFENVKKDLGGNRYDSDFTEIQKRQKKLGPAQKLADFNSNMMDREDMRAKKNAYIRSLANYFTAKGIDTTQKIPPNILMDARAHAIEEAKYCTFQNFSELAQTLQSWEDRNAGTKLLIGGIMPFKRTPINITKAAVEFSPVGLGIGIRDTVKAVQRGDVTATEGIDKIASGLTGSAILGLGALLAWRGLLRAGDDDEDKTGILDDAAGSQEYSLVIPVGKIPGVKDVFGFQEGDTYSYTIDWAAPAAIPLFMGAEVFQAVTQRDTDTTFGEAMLEGIMRMFDPIVEMTCMSGFSNAIQGAVYNKGNPMYGAFSSVAQNYAGQFVPTLLSQIAKTVDPVKRTTFYDANSKMPKLLQQIAQQNENKIPGLSQYQPAALDVWGREIERSDNMLIRALQNFVSPGELKKVESSAMEDELRRLHNLGYEGMMPSQLSKSSKINDERISAEQWSAWQKEKGQSAYSSLKNFMGTSEYQALTDDQKAKFIQKVYDFASASGKVAAGGNADDLARWIEAAKSSEEQVGMPKEKFVSLYAYKASLEDEMDEDEFSASIKQGVWEEYINGRSDLTDEQKSYVKDNIKFWQSKPADPSGYNKAKNAGYTDLDEIQNLISGRKEFDRDGNNSYTNTEIYEYISSATEDNAEREKMWKALAGSGTSKTWYELAKEEAPKLARQQKAKQALDSSVKEEKQSQFNDAISEYGSGSRYKVYMALMSVDATNEERAAYYNYINAKKGWKASWSQMVANKGYPN